MIANGTRPTVLDKRDYSFHRTFGALQKNAVDSLADFDLDNGKTMPDQNAEGNPFSCTAYNVTELAMDQDGKEYSQEYTYMKTLDMQGLPPTTNGSDMRPAHKTATTYGLLPQEDMPQHLIGRGEDFTADRRNWASGVDVIAGKLENRQGKFFNVYDDGGLDWFDSFLSALHVNRAEKRSISMGTPWFGKILPGGIMAVPTAEEIKRANDTPERVSWHATKVSGLVTRHGKRYLKCKPWQGAGYGDKGWVYLSRETINALMEIRGSVAFTQKDATQEDIQTIKLGIFEEILRLIYKIIGVKRYA